MRVLAAVLAHARRIALDVAGIVRRLVERRREQQRQSVVAADQMFVDRGHGARGARRIGRAGNHAPGLRDRIDAAFAVRGRARAACRRRNSRADTNRRPSRRAPARCCKHAACSRQRRALAARRVARPVRANASERRVAGTSRARRSRPCRARRPGSCRRSSRRCPSAAGRALPMARLCRARARNARTALPSRRRPSG